MRLIRLVVSVIAVVGLLAGYLASEAAYFQGQSQSYAEHADAARGAALVVLVLAIVLCFVREREEPS